MCIFFTLSVFTGTFSAFFSLLGVQTSDLFGLYGCGSCATPSMFRQGLLWALEVYYVTCAILLCFIGQMKVYNGGEVTFPTRSVTFPRHLKQNFLNGWFYPLDFNWISSEEINILPASANSQLTVTLKAKTGKVQKMVFGFYPA